jgi:hypothetical protein
VGPLACLTGSRHFHSYSNKLRNGAHPIQRQHCLNHVGSRLSGLSTEYSPRRIGRIPH